MVVCVKIHSFLFVSKSYISKKSSQNLFFILDCKKFATCVKMYFFSKKNRLYFNECTIIKRRNMAPTGIQSSAFQSKLEMTSARLGLDVQCAVKGFILGMGSSDTELRPVPTILPDRIISNSKILSI